MIVVGSLNVDYIALVERLPAPGETVAATGLIRRFGGKGANQAIAAARQGAKAGLIGRVGSDDEGRAYCRRLRDEGIDTTGIHTSSGGLTGTALIAVERSAENMIVVASGANGELRPSDIRGEWKRIASARVLLVQFEIPMVAVIEAVRLANRANVPVVLNPSPLREGFPWGRCQVETLLANAGEAQEIFGLPAESLQARSKDWRGAMRERAIEQLIITRGPKPTLCLTAEGYLETPTLRVRPVDTVGAGDAFAGTFAAERAAGLALPEAVRRANCAGALATLKAGAQEAMPTRAATARALRSMSLVGHGSGTKGDAKMALV